MQYSLRTSDNNLKIHILRTIPWVYGLTPERAEKEISKLQQGYPCLGGISVKKRN